MKNQYILKFCITATSGKNTDLVCQIVRDTAEETFTKNYMPTIGVDIASKVVTVNDQEVKLILHTLAGQEHFGKLRRFYYEGSIGNIIMFDKSDPASFAAVPYYYQDYCQIQGSEKPVVILGITTNSEKILLQEGQHLAAQLGCLYFESHPSDKILLPILYEELTRIVFGEVLGPVRKSRFSLILSWGNLRLIKLRIFVFTLTEFFQRKFFGRKFKIDGEEK